MQRNYELKYRGLQSSGQARCYKIIHIVYSIFFLFIAMISVGQGSEVVATFDKINRSHDEIKDFKSSVVYTIYDYDGSVQETMPMTIYRVNNRYLIEYEDTKVLKEKDFALYVDAKEREIMILPPETDMKVKYDATAFEMIGNYVNLCDSAFLKQYKGRKSIVMDCSGFGLDYIELSYNQKSYLLESIYFEFYTPSGSISRMKVEYESLDPNVTDQEKQLFAYNNFFTVSNNEFKPTKAYSGYEIKNHYKKVKFK